jgi:squalene-hopene/tetraprenyl-beta-curcumene cyclase
MKTMLIAAAVLGVFDCSTKQEEESILIATPQEDLSKKLVGAYGRAADWVVSQQGDDGAWKEMGQPSLAYTGLIVAALAEAPADLRKKYRPAIDKAVEFMLKKQNEDGSFGEGPGGGYLKVYTTSIALMALSLATPDKKDPIGNARGYLKNNQLKEGVDKGSLGYGDKEPKMESGKLVEKPSIPNLSTTGFAAEGLARSGLPKDDAFWKLVIEYVAKCQNNSETNNDPAFLARLKEKNLSVGDDGGLFYAANPDDVRGGTVKITDKTIINSYGSMTYDGIKTYLYAGLTKDDPRVKAAIDWVRKNYSVEAHPGFAFDEKRTDLQGLFYYYLMMTRAFEAMGEKTFKTFDGKEHKWANELGEQLLKIQQEEKMWKNENPRWREDSPLLVTSYVLNILNVVTKHVH